MTTKLLDPVLIVEGHQEARFIKELHKRNKCQEIKVMNLDGANGKNVSLGVLATKIDALLSGLNREFRPFIILIDRERRTESAQQITNELKNQLNLLGYDKNKLIIGVVDRKIEAWMLPFVDQKGNFPVEPTEGFEGESGEKKLGERLRKQGKKYKKMDIGIQILLAIDPTKLAKVSISFRKFYDEARDYCKWMNGKKIRYKGK